MPKLSPYSLCDINAKMTITNVTYSAPRTRVDTVVNAVGDVRSDQPGADMAVLLAILSSFKNKRKSGAGLNTVRLTVRGETVEPRRPFDKLMANGGAIQTAVDAIQFWFKKTVKGRWLIFHITLNRTRPNG